MPIRALAAALALYCSTTAVVQGETLEIGPGRKFQSIEEAYEHADPGDILLVYPLDSHEPYRQVALLISKPRITLRAVNDKFGDRVQIDGTGFNYTGAGSVPRAIFQFNPDAGGGVVEGFDLTGAHNDSFNGAGVRINQANRITIRDCEIHDNDMGIMSNGELAAQTGADQWIISCLIHSNGNLQDPGYNHNLYLGGTSATLLACDIYSAVTGHNVKSRAHLNRIFYCYIHDSANRELDLVDEQGNTDAPESDAILIGNIIVKSPQAPGNHNVMQFGQDGGNNHNGTLYLIHNTIITPYSTSVVDLSAPGARLQMHNNIVWDARVDDPSRTLVQYRSGADPQGAAITHNWLAHYYVPPPDAKAKWLNNYYAGEVGEDLFVNPGAGDYHLRPGPCSAVDLGLPLSGLRVSVPPGPGTGRDDHTIRMLQEYQPPLMAVARRIDNLPDAGAYEQGDK